MDRILVSRRSSNSYRMLQLGTCALALVVLLVATTVFASPTGSVVGSVKDPSVSVVVGAKLTITNVATNAKIDTVSDNNGGFQFFQLAPTLYYLDVDLQALQ